MRQTNPFAREETLTIDESCPLAAPIPPKVRAVCIERDFFDLKSQPRLDEINEVMAQLPKDTLELIDIHYNCRLKRLPCLERQNGLRYVHLGVGNLRDYSPLYNQTRLEQLFLMSAPLTSLSAFREMPLKRIRLIRGRFTSLDASATRVLLQECRHLTTLGDVRIAMLTLQTCKRFDLSSLASVRELWHLSLISPGPLPSLEPLVGCKSLASLVITATPLGKTDFHALAVMPTLKWLFLAAGDARVSKVAEVLPHIMVTNGKVCFREGKELPPQTYYEEGDAARIARHG